MKQARKVALFSDIHGNISGLRAVLDAIDRVGDVDHMVAAGDIVGGSSGAGDLLDLLNERDVTMVRGNSEEATLDPERAVDRITPEYRDYATAMNEWLLEHLSLVHLRSLARLPITHRFRLGSVAEVLVCHAAPDDPWARINRHDADLGQLRSRMLSCKSDVICYGHWHRCFVMVLGGKTLINVASIGLRTDGLAAYTILETSDERMVIHQCYVPYDAAEEARLNALHGVPDVTDYVQDPESALTPRQPQPEWRTARHRPDRG
jgi:putative phosphoesterase